MATDYTANYHLDKYTALDKPNLRDQYNAAMDKIDAQLKISDVKATDAVQTVEEMATTVDAITSELSKKAFIFENVEAMCACTTLKAGDICRTLSFANSIAGGGAFYKVESTGTNDGIENFTNGDVFMQHVTSGIITPEEFGARANPNGSDSAAIARALEEDVPVVFSNATYNITETIVLNRSLSLAENTVLRAVRTLTPPVGELTSAVIDCLENDHEVRTITGGIIDCNNYADYAIRFMNTYGSITRNVMLHDARTASVYYSTNCHHAWFINNKITNLNTLATGIINECRDLKVLGCEIMYTVCAIEHRWNILQVSDCHFWNGGERNPNANTYGIKVTTPKTIGDRQTLILTDVYIDSFKYGVCRQDYAAEDTTPPWFVVNALNCLFYIPGTSVNTDHVAIEAFKAVNCLINTQGSTCVAATGKKIVQIDYGTYYGLVNCNIVNPQAAFTAANNVTVTSNKSYVYDKVLYFEVILTINGSLTQDSVSSWYLLGTLDHDYFMPIINSIKCDAFNYTQSTAYVARLDISNANHPNKSVLLARSNAAAAGNQIQLKFAIPLR